MLWDGGHSQASDCSLAPCTAQHAHAALPGRRAELTPTDRCGRRAWAPGTSGLGQGRRGRTVERSRCYTPCRMLPPPTLQTRQPKEAGHTVTLTQSPVRSHAAPRERQRAWHVWTGECPSHAAPLERSESGSGHSQSIIACNSASRVAATRGASQQCKSLSGDGSKPRSSGQLRV
jgi:hypothetical protein